MGLGRAKFFPGFFARLHPRFKTPSTSIVFLFLLSSAMVFMGANMTVFGIIADATSLNCVVLWLVVTIAFLRLQKSRPDLPRPYRVKHPKLIGWLSLLSCLAFICLYMPFSPSSLTVVEWGILGVYAAFALVFTLLWARKDKTSLEERRELMGLNDIGE